MDRVAISDLARRLGEEAEAVCRHYLSRGRRQGRYWRVGDVHNSPGSSLYVRLTGPVSGKGRRGKWTDAATGEHGDLVDLIRLNLGHDDWLETVDEVCGFLRLKRPAMASAEPCRVSGLDVVRDASEAAKRLFRIGQPLAGTPAATYLAGRGLAYALAAPALRYYPRCYHRLTSGTTLHRPALLAAVTDLGGTVTGVSRTWLAQDGRGKADLPDPRRALGHLLGHGVRFAGTGPGVMVVGEGLETVLSVNRLLPGIPAVAALSASHLAALLLPPGLRRLYVARDADQEGGVPTRRSEAGLQPRASPRCGNSSQRRTISTRT
jgi:hypothetical protein